MPHWGHKWLWDTDTFKAEANHPIRRRLYCIRRWRRGLNRAAACAVLEPEPCKSDLSDAPGRSLIEAPLPIRYGNVSVRTYMQVMATISPEEMLARKVRRDGEIADGKLAMTEYLAEPEQRAANTAKQREARLTREAADALLPPPMKPVRKKKKPTV